MARPSLLSQDIINDYLKIHPLWAQPVDEPTVIVREIGSASFIAAVGIFNSIALLAEKADHHPDILLYGWNKLRITLSTHDQGGLTELDFKVAGQIDGLNF
ncbi:MAG: 4a-hydroxytetrahydrobiopterin dehydratase [Ignavibacteria bacterium]|nr:4a-hydroxytetrahydrobiopterin dehydratase [Ignavibacteria bacterium]